MAPIKKVCLVGANGNVGTLILDALVHAKTFDVSIIRRANSTSVPAHAEAITQIPVSSSMPLDELTTALAGQDAVIAAFPLGDVSAHLRLVEAAYRAGVRRFIPADFGSCDAADPVAQKYLKLYTDKEMVRQKCVTLAAGSGGKFEWTTIVCGHFFDYGLRDGLLHFDLATQTAQILNDGNINASASTLPRVAEALVRVFQLPEETANRAVFVQSFNPTQNEILASLEKATGKTWKRQTVEPESFLEAEKKKFDAGDHAALEEIVFVLGTMDADWTKRDEFAMDLLGLKDQNLDEVVAQVVAEYEETKA